MWRTIDAPLKTIRLPVRTFLLSHHRNPPSLPSPSSLHFFSLSKTLTISPSIPNPLSPILAFTTRCSNSAAFCRGANLVTARCISSISSPAAPNQQHTAVDWNEPVTCSEVGDGDKGTNIEEDAWHVDLKSLVEQNKQNFIPPTSRMTNYVVLKFRNLSQAPGLGSCISGSNCCYMVVFQYGSIVLFNVCEHEVDEYLNIVRKHASGLLPEMRKDEYEVREKPTLNTWMQGGLDYIMLQFLNTDGIRMIGSVLGQSIALDYYGRQVDGMVAEFTDINRGMEKTGTFSMDSKKLFQIVGKANSNLADVILKLGLFERSDIAWKDAKYAQIWEYLRDEFELTQRFASLDFKLKFVEHNIRFLQEILQNRKSDFLEWLIIVLISVEIIISVFDLVQRSGFKFF
ncbi:hypothetical protein SADUNF_Sadunf08G0033900 [Salix dunnii]|uniref:DUF155 domain-containing protein n=1 Tax=Salix dunnii TaxID=1413687 RepID=A0A835JZ93_9ROSI|nr:hypothetical protein SADUNF_Sadunf08G0033900 [Salix dunnii]